MKKFLHVGCGGKTKEQTTAGFNSDDWKEIRYDVNPMVHPDIIGDVVDMKSVESESMGAIFSSHNIEHLYPHDVSASLDEFYRVLKPCGFVVLTCPDIQEVCKHVATGNLTEPIYISQAGPITALDVLYGHTDSLAAGNLYMAHRTGFSKKTLIACFQKGRFQSVVAMARPAPFFDLWLVAMKIKIPNKELKRLALEHFPTNHLQNS